MPRGPDGITIPGIIAVPGFLSRAAAKWTTGATKWWTTSMVPVRWAGRVGDRIRGWGPTGW